MKFIFLFCIFVSLFIWLFVLIINMICMLRLCSRFILCMMEFIFVVDVETSSGIKIINVEFWCSVMYGDVCLKNFMNLFDDDEDEDEDDVIWMLFDCVWLLESVLLLWNIVCIVMFCVRIFIFIWYVLLSGVCMCDDVCLGVVWCLCDVLDVFKCDVVLVMCDMVWRWNWVV